MKSLKERVDPDLRQSTQYVLDEMRWSEIGAKDPATVAREEKTIDTSDRVVKPGIITKSAEKLSQFAGSSTVDEIEACGPRVARHGPACDTEDRREKPFSARNRKPPSTSAANRTLFTSSGPKIRIRHCPTFREGAVSVVGAVSEEFGHPFGLAAIGVKLRQVVHENSAVTNLIAPTSVGIGVMPLLRDDIDLQGQTPVGKPDRTDVAAITNGHPRRGGCGPAVRP